jgi:hypothetical protein
MTRRAQLITELPPWATTRSESTMLGTPKHQTVLLRFVCGVDHPFQSDFAMRERANTMKRECFVRRLRADHFRLLHRERMTANRKLQCPPPGPRSDQGRACPGIVACAEGRPVHNAPVGKAATGRSPQTRTAHLQYRRPGNAPCCPSSCVRATIAPPGGCRSSFRSAPPWSGASNACHRRSAPGRGKQPSP